MTPTFVTFLFMGDRPRTLNSFEAAACPPPMDRKPRADARFITNTLLFQSWKMQDFSRATGSFRFGTGASKSNQGHFYWPTFSIRHFLGKIDNCKSPLRRTFPVAFRKPPTRKFLACNNGAERSCDLFRDALTDKLSSMTRLVNGILT